MKRRNTDQRNVVYQCINDLGHATINQVIETVHSNDPSISVSTIYRNVGVLVTENQVKKFKINQVEVYETVKEKHYHFMCNKCGSIIDLDAQALEPMFTDLCNIEGNKVEEIEVFFSGICKKCLNEEKEQKPKNN